MTTNASRGIRAWLTSAATPRRSIHPLVPGWLVRLAAIGWRVLVTLALGVVLFGIAGQLATVAASIILGLILAATLAPYVTERRARGWGAAKAAGVVMLAALLVLGAVVAAVIIAVVPSLGAIVAAFDAGIEAARTQLTALGVPSELTGFMQRISDAIRGLVLGGLNDFVAAAANTVTIAILGGFLTFFLLMDGDKAWDWVLASTDGWRRDALMSGGRRALDQVGGYIRGTSLMAVANALLAGVIMLVFGVPLAGPLAVVALVAAFVPYVGRALTAVLIVTVILATRGVVPAAVFLLLYVVGSIALERVLARITSGRRLDLHPILAVLGLPIGFALGGFSGLVVVLPVLAFAQTAASVLITTLGREPIADACPVRDPGERWARPRLAGPPGSVELARARRGRIVRDRGPGRAAVPCGHHAGRHGRDPRSDPGAGRGRARATRPESHDRRHGRDRGDERRDHRGGGPHAGLAGRPDGRARRNGDGRGGELRGPGGRDRVAGRRRSATGCCRPSRAPWRISSASSWCCCLVGS